MNKKAAALIYSVRLQVVGKYFGQLCFVIAALTAVPLVVSFFFGEGWIGLRYGLVIIALLVLGAFLARIQAPIRVQTNEAMVIVALIFLFTPLLMTYPMMASGLGFLDALFEAISGSTTTGLSTTATVGNKPNAFLFARAWMQWYGGLGIVVLSLVFVIQPGIVTRRLAVTETDEDDLVGGVTAHSRRILWVYGILTIVGIAVLWLLGAGGLNAILYTFAAVSTGGFAPHDGSLSALGGWPAQTLVTLLCIAGATSFIFYRRVFRMEWRRFLGDPQVRTLLAAGLLVSVGLACFMGTLGGLAWTDAARHAFFLAFSAQTTAGFSSVDVSQLDPGAKLLTILSMIVGGGTGSTAGGIKILRLLILLRLVQHLLVRACMPKRAIFEARLEGQRLKPEETQAALLLILLFILVIVFSWFPFIVLGYDPLDSLFEVVSATGTVGLSAGVSSPTLHPILKGILCLDMLLGRLEILPYFVLFYPRTWLGKRGG